MWSGKDGVVGVGAGRLACYMAGATVMSVAYHDIFFARGVGCSVPGVLGSNIK